MKSISQNSLLALFNSSRFGSLNALYGVLGVKGDSLLKYLYRSSSSNYRAFNILKRNGATRNIKAPRPVLKMVQKRLAEELSSFYTPKSSSHGFQVDRSVKTNALSHVGKTFVFNIDLKDFFETIHFGRVKNLFMSKPINAPHNVAVVMAQICCCDGKLAQGAPTSPIISNMICRKLDSQLQALARSKKCHYSRYADDITFSFTCSKRYLPKEIVEVSEDGFPVVGKELAGIIGVNGFCVNSEKTRLQGKHQRQVVTGLVVNKFPNLRREYIRKTNSMIHALRKYGAEAAEEKYLEIIGKEKAPLMNRQRIRTKNEPGDFFIKVVKGRLNYIQMVRGRGDSVYRKLAYRFSVAIGKENKEFLKSPLELLANSVFVVENCIDQCMGTAFLLEGYGLITNHHVVESVTPSLARHAVTFELSGLGRKFSADLLYSDKSLDMAIFYPGPEFDAVPRLSRARKDLILPLQKVISIGYPKHVDGSGAYITEGRTTQLRRNVSFDLWCVDTVLMEGNSGGPILNSSLEVVGVAARGSDKNSVNSYIYGFIPATVLDMIVRSDKFNFSRSLFKTFYSGPGFSHVPKRDGWSVLCNQSK